MVERVLILTGGGVYSILNIYIYLYTHMHIHLHLHTHKYIYVLPAPPPPPGGEGEFHHPTSPIIHPSIIHSSFIIPSSNIPHHPSSSSRLPTPPSHRGGGGKSPSEGRNSPWMPWNMNTASSKLFFYASNSKC